MKVQLWALVSAFGLLAASSTLAAPASERTSDGCDLPSGRVFFAFGRNDGFVSASSCDLRKLQEMVYSYEPVKDAVVIEHARNIRYYYQARTRRQQLLADTSAGLVFFNGLGYATQLGGKDTLPYWGPAVALPVIIAQFNAYEPTGDLFSGGGLGLDLMNSRYVGFTLAASQLKTYLTESTGQTATVCRNLKAQLNAATRSWGAGQTDTLVVLPEATSVDKACTDVQTFDTAVGAFNAASEISMKNAGRQYATDMLALNNALISRDYKLRYSPAQALTSIVATPLTVGASLVTGQDHQAALDALKTQNAFADFNLKLSMIDVPPVPGAATAKVGISDNVLGRRAPAAAARTNPSDAEVAALIDTMSAAVDALNADAPRRQHVATLINNIQAAAASSSINLTYNINARAVQVSLTIPGASQSTVLTAVPTPKP